MFKLVLEKLEEPEIKLPTSAGSSKSKSCRKASISAFLTMPQPLTVWITINLWKILQEMGIPDQLTCFLRNPYAGQEATLRTGNGTTDWFQSGKEYIKAAYCHPTYLTYMQTPSNVEAETPIIFGHLMQRADSFERTLMLGKIEGRRRGQQRMRWLDGITGTMDMNLSKLHTTVKDREVWHVAVHGVAKIQKRSSD